MKTLKSLLATALTAVFFTASAFTTFAAEPAIEVAAKKSSFNKIWVSGNVKIVLTQGNTEGVTATENYNAEKTSVQQQGQTLYINTMESSQVTLTVSVKDLQRIEAYGDAVVVTDKNLDVRYLQVFLAQNASAKIKTNTESLYTVVKDDARLKMSGAADQSTLVASNMKNVKMADLATLKSERYASEKMMNATQVALVK